LSMKSALRCNIGVGNVGASVQLAAIHRQIELGSRITGDEFRILQTEYPGKQPAVDVNVVSDRLRADANAGVGRAICPNYPKPNFATDPKTYCAALFDAPR
jgi:hypothetical protein